MRSIKVNHSHCLSGEPATDVRRVPHALLPLWRDSPGESKGRWPKSAQPRAARATATPTTYRGLLKGWSRLGEVLFLGRDAPWYKTSRSKSENEMPLGGKRKSIPERAN